jgi:hypothetical protein
MNMACELFEDYGTTVVLFDLAISCICELLHQQQLTTSFDEAAYLYHPEDRLRVDAYGFLRMAAGSNSVVCWDSEKTIEFSKLR